MAVTSFRYSSVALRRKPREGDEKTLKSGVVYVRQARRTEWPHPGTLVGSRGQTLWEWVVKGSGRDRMAGKPRYGTDRKGESLPPPPEGYRLLECGKPLPKGTLVYFDPFPSSGKPAGWHASTLPHGESYCQGEVRAYAIKID